jgi:hypothetical protein
MKTLKTSGLKPKENRPKNNSSDSYDNKFDEYGNYINTDFDEPSENNDEYDYYPYDDNYDIRN